MSEGRLVTYWQETNDSGETVLFPNTEGDREALQALRNPRGLREGRTLSEADVCPIERDETVPWAVSFCAIGGEQDPTRMLGRAYARAHWLRGNKEAAREIVFELDRGAQRQISSN